MTKVHPNGSATAAAAGAESNTSSNAVVLTVWKKSLLFNCDGFTVFDSTGNLVFRVDNYISGGRKPEIVLMDASGKSLLTIRRKRLSLSDNWLVFQGETAENPLYSVTKHMNLLNSSSNSKSVLAYVNSIVYGDTNKKKNNKMGGGDGSSSPTNKNNNKVLYEIEGSYVQRCCSIFDSKRRQVAEIKRKEGVGGMVFGVDVFKLAIACPHEIQLPHAMSLVVILDQMFGSWSRRPYYIRSFSFSSFS